MEISKEGPQCGSPRDGVKKVYVLENLVRVNLERKVLPRGYAAIFNMQSPRQEWEAHCSCLTASQMKQEIRLEVAVVASSVAHLSFSYDGMGTGVFAKASVFDATCWKLL